MKFILIATVLLISACIVGAVITSWRFRCPKCRSFRYWNHERLTYGDDHRPHIEITAHYNKCSSCGHKETLDPTEKLKDFSRDSY